MNNFKRKNYKFIKENRYLNSKMVQRYKQETHRMLKMIHKHEDS